MNIFDLAIKEGFSSDDAQKCQKAFDDLWEQKQIEAKPILEPSAYIVGGQPGAGKSDLLKLAEKETNNNIIIINPDEYRMFHPKYKEIQHQYGDEASKHTGLFSGSIANLIRDKAISEKYNFVIEGTFRREEIPLSMVKQCKEAGYKINILIKTCPQKESWEHGCLQRYNLMKEIVKRFNIREYPRFVEKSFHDSVVNVLTERVVSVFEQTKSDINSFRVFSREGLIFNSKLDRGCILHNRVNNEINREPNTFILTFSYEDKKQPDKLLMRINGVDGREYLNDYPETLSILLKNKSLSNYSEELQSCLLTNDFNKGLLKDMTINKDGQLIAQHLTQSNQNESDFSL
ncbi:hypothetical protein A9G07_06140 [Gilliamella sp. wkB72]|uniref:zeta toxin family protein n=1 Tax=Gilliamella sp. wkB72 TaxID=3120265 RepID=UPI000810F087|nr:zeta toxin family protein [Gilliamella apicola]OCL23357.1 hypothetical protein A9G07_06140 [Gilliamella apicola]